MKKVTLLLAVLFSFCAVNTAFAGNVKGSRDAWPLAGTTDAWPVAKTTDAWPVAKTNDAWPVAGTTDAWPVAGKNDAWPVAKTTDAWPVAKTTDAWPVAKTNDAWPVAKTNDAWPVAKTTDAWPVSSKKNAWPAPKVNALTKRLGRAVAVAEVSAKHKIGNQTIVCGRCGKAMSAHQHCVDTNYTDLCSSMAEENELDPILLEQAEELLQADREAHGGYARHSLEFYYLELKEAQAENAAADQNAQAAQKHYCIYCGEEIDRDNKPCPQSNGLQTCRSTCPECGEDLNTTKNLVNNIHRCKFKGKYTIHPNTMKMITK